MTTPDTNNTSPPDISPAPATPPSPGTPGYDPLLDPRVKQWRDSLLSEAGRKEQEIAALKEQTRQIQEQLAPLQQKLTEYQKREKEQSDASLTEIQRSQAKLQELEQREKDFKSQLDTAVAERTRIDEQHSHEREAWRNEREMISLLGIKGIYPNEFEQEGLFARVRALQYVSAEERQQKLQALLDIFVQTKAAAPAAGAKENASPGGSSTPSFSVPAPPGGSPPRVPQLLDDNYTDEELTQLARTNREQYDRIAAQRAAIRKARGALPIYVK